MGFFIDGDIIEKKDLSLFAQKNGYTEVFFDYDEFDPHLLIVNGNESDFELLDIELFSENQEVVDSLLQLGLKFDGDTFVIPLNRITEVDGILESLKDHS